MQCHSDAWLVMGLYTGFVATKFSDKTSTCRMDIFNAQMNGATAVTNTCQPTTAHISDSNYLHA